MNEDGLSFTDFRCDCCRLPRARKQKYPGIGYWCDDCMYGGCFSDDIDAQSPSGRPPYYRNQAAIHAWLGVDLAHDEWP